MNIITSQPPQRRLTNEPVSAQTRADFPDLPSITGCQGCKPIDRDTLGYEAPISDSAVIGERMEELEKELKLIPKVISSNKKEFDNGLKLSTVGIGFLTAGAVAGFIGPFFTPAAVVPALTAIAVGGIMVGGGKEMLERAGSTLQPDSREYYQNRAELDHLRRGEEWEAAPPYISG